MTHDGPEEVRSHGRPGDVADGAESRAEHPNSRRMLGRPSSVRAYTRCQAGRHRCAPTIHAMTDTAPRPATRTERDSMGEMEVPADALYGASTQRAVLNFPISGRGLPPRFLHALALDKLAAAETNRELGLLDDDVAGAIAAAAR